MKRYIPNILTLINLAAGFIAILLIFNGDKRSAVWLLCAAMVLDFADGLAARLLGAYSELGKQLDSLADVVSFGVAPGILMYLMIRDASGLEFMGEHAAWISIIIPVLSGLRLAIFNIDTEQSDSFRGLPTPANAFFTFSLVLASLYSDSGLIESVTSSREILTALTIILSVLMVTRIPMISLKIKSVRFKGNELRLIFIGLSLLLFILAGVASLPLIIIIYIVVSIANAITTG